MDDFTNLEIENKLSKEMRIISREIFASTSVKIDFILSNIVSDMGKLYASQTKYRNHLTYFANHNNLFANILAKKISQESGKTLSDPNDNVTAGDEAHCEKSKTQMY